MPRIIGSYDGEEFIDAQLVIDPNSLIYGMMEYGEGGDCYVTGLYFDGSEDGGVRRFKLIETHQGKHTHCYPMVMELWSESPEYLIASYRQKDESIHRLKVGLYFGDEI